MRRHQIAKLVEQTYLSSKQNIALWMWQNHLQFVAQKALELSDKFNANADLVVAGAFLHDFGDAFVSRHASNHEEVSKEEAIKVLQKADYSPQEIQEILEKVIAPHSCYEGNMPETLEGKVLATADALAHLITDFYVQFAWKNMPDGKSYQEFLVWVSEKLERDFNDKIFFEEIRDEVREKYLALKLVFNSPK
jgi:HD superfamily phosphodiesterase